jgi:cytochrome c peroxidase
MFLSRTYFLILIAVGGCSSRRETGAGKAYDTDESSSYKVAHEAALSDADFTPLPPREPVDVRKVALGRRLFDDVALSEDRTVACVTCHLRELGYSNGAAKATLPTREPGEVNVPTVLNVSYNYRYNWDGRFETVEALIQAIVKKPSVMRSSWEVIVPRLTADSTYAAAFKASYPEGIQPATITNALALYIRSLTTPGARFDRWLSGDKNALSDEEHAGYLLFRSYGCSSCHQGRNIGGNLIQRFGIMNDYFADRGYPTPADRGLARVTDDPQDEHFFRVPSLRNVERTAPYFHDGTAATIDDAVRVMGRYQLGRELTDLEKGRLVAFLKTLTGDLDDGALK